MDQIAALTDVRSHDTSPKMQPELNAKGVIIQIFIFPVYRYGSTQTTSPDWLRVLFTAALPLLLIQSIKIDRR